MTAWKWFRPLQRGMASNLEGWVISKYASEVKTCVVTGCQFAIPACNHILRSKPWIWPKGDGQIGCYCLNEVGRMRVHGADRSVEHAKIHSGSKASFKNTKRMRQSLTSMSRRPWSARNLSRWVEPTIFFASWRTSCVWKDVLSSQVFVISLSWSPSTKQMGHGCLEFVPRMRAIVHLVQRMLDQLSTLWGRENRTYCSS
jgi:hypothetical protein